MGVEEVVRVTVTDTSHRKRNMALAAGILVGVASAATLGVMLTSTDINEGCNACAAGMVAGVGGGVAIGMIPSHRTIYRATPTHASTAP
jgi:ammonia channel protein AmtB